MKKKIVFGVVGVVAVLVTGIPQESSAWFFRANASATTNSHNQSNSNNRTNSWNANRYEYDLNKSVNDSYNKFDSHAVSDSYKGNNTEESVGKRLASHDVGGAVSDSILGDLNIHVGHKRVDIRLDEGAAGSVVDASVNSNIVLGNMQK